MKNRMLENPSLGAGSEAIGKAPYARPVLREFGSVRHLTKGGTGSNVDGWGGTNTNPGIPPGQQPQ